MDFADSGVPLLLSSVTIAICLKVGDGVVLGTDSASSLIGDGDTYYNIYHSAEKSINLVRGWPVGMITYGLGGLGGISIGSLARDLRDRLSGEIRTNPDWTLSRATYTLEDVARRVREYFYDELYLLAYPEAKRVIANADVGGETSVPVQDEGFDPEFPANPEPPRFPGLGFIVAGFSGAAYYPEAWTVEIQEDGQCAGPALLHGQEQAGLVYFRGQSEALHRLLYGWSDEAYERLRTSGLSDEVAYTLLTSYTNLAHPAMPMQDAIELVRYLAEVTVGFVRFKPGPPTVAPPIDIAAITRHEGFRWAARKHYFSRELNQPVTLLCSLEKPMDPKPTPPEPRVIYSYPPPSIKGGQVSTVRPPPPPKLTPEEIRMVEEAVRNRKGDHW